jgi:hypothetical protein
MKGNPIGSIMVMAAWGCTLIAAVRSVRTVLGHSEGDISDLFAGISKVLAAIACGIFLAMLVGSVAQPKAALAAVDAFDALAFDQSSFAARAAGAAAITIIAIVLSGRHLSAMTMRKITAIAVAILAASLVHLISGMIQTVARPAYTIIASAGTNLHGFLAFCFILGFAALRLIALTATAVTVLDRIDPLRKKTPFSS